MKTFLKISKLKFVSYVIVCILFAGIIIPSCSSDPFMDDKESNERLKAIKLISESNEFQEYLEAHFNFIETANSIEDAEIVGEINGENVYKAMIDIKLFNEVINTRKIFLSNYPEYELLDDEGKLEVIKSACGRSEVLNNYISQKEISSIVSLKSYEEDDDKKEKERFSFEDFDSWEDAYDACKDYTESKSVESCGYIYPNGTAVFITDTAATNNRMTIPFTGVNGAQGWFHYHLSGNTGMSRDDSTAVDSLKQYGVKQAIIITKDSIATYNF